MIKGIIFDFGEVLTSPTSEEEKQQRLIELGDLLSLPPSDVWPYLFQGEPAKKWMMGFHACTFTTPTAFRAFLKNLGVNL